MDANLQPDQAVRYKMRGQRDQLKGLYADFEIILCAPEHYISNRADLDGFDRCVSFERIASFIRDDTSRAEYRAAFLETASSKRVNAWKRNDDVATNKFWDAAYRLARDKFPILEMKPLKVTKDSTWITFRPRDLPTMPKHVYISLKGDRGYVDLTFGRTTAYLFRPLVADLLEQGMSVHQTSASTAVRIEVPGFQISEGFPSACLKLDQAFEASCRLIDFYRRSRVLLEKHAKAATP